MMFGMGQAVFWTYFGYNKNYNCRNNNGNEKLDEQDSTWGPCGQKKQISQDKKEDRELNRSLREQRR